MYKIKFHKKAEKELGNLNKSLQILFAKKLSQIANNPQIGKDLGNKSGLNLYGLKKVYFNKKRHRIVYKVIEDKIVIYIIAIGKRDDLKVYKDASKRYSE